MSIFEKLLSHKLIAYRSFLTGTSVIYALVPLQRIVLGDIIRSNYRLVIFLDVKLGKLGLMDNLFNYL